MKTAFITVRPKYNSYGLFSIAPLGPVYLATMLSNKGHEARVFDESRSFVFNRRNGKVNPAVLKSDFIGLSVISPAANRAKELIEAIRQQKPDIRMAVGGPHVTGEEQAREFAQLVDVVVQNEAETIIDEVVNGKLNGVVKGECIDNMDELPVPDLNLLEYNRRKYLDFFKLTPLETTRGCPRNCEFCSVSNIHGKKIRRRSDELVIKEVQQRLEEGYKRLFLVDDNFSVLPKQRISLLEALIAEKQKGKWFDSIIVQDEVPGILKGGEEYIQMMKKAGISTVMLGVESFDDKLLKALQKTHKTTDSEEAIRLLKKHGLVVYAFGMAKPELDTKETIRKQFRKLREIGVTYADMTIETPVPGTQYWEKCKSNITALKNGKPDWDKWTFLSAVIPTKYMSRDEFHKEIRKNMQWFYSIPRAIRELFKGELRKSLTILYVWYISGRMYG